MRYVHNKPAPKYEPIAYRKPTETKEIPKGDPNQLSLFDKSVKSDVNKLGAEIDVLENGWDEIYEEYLTNEHPDLKKKLSELDKAIKEKEKEILSINNNNLPF